MSEETRRNFLKKTGIASLGALGLPAVAQGEQADTQDPSLVKTLDQLLRGKDQFQEELEEYNKLVNRAMETPYDPGPVHPTSEDEAERIAEQANEAEISSLDETMHERLLRYGSDSPTVKLDDDFLLLGLSKTDSWRTRNEDPDVGRRGVSFPRMSYGHEEIHAKSLLTDIPVATSLKTKESIGLASRIYQPVEIPEGEDGRHVEVTFDGEVTGHGASSGGGVPLGRMLSVPTKGAAKAKLELEVINAGDDDDSKSKELWSEEISGVNVFTVDKWLNDSVTKYMEPDTTYYLSVKFTCSTSAVLAGAAAIDFAPFVDSGNVDVGSSLNTLEIKPW